MAINELMKVKTLMLSALALSVAGFYFWINTSVPVIDESKISDSSLVEYPSEFNFRQTVNDCGPYNTAALTRALTKLPVDSQEFAKNIGYRLPNKYTLPWGMESQLKENGIEVEIPNLGSLSDEERLEFLFEKLSGKKPIIILGERENYEHYVSIFGFDREKYEFYVYDSLFDKGADGLTIDENGELPGNRTFPGKDLLDFWRGGGMYGLYKWYAIVAS